MSAPAVVENQSDLSAEINTEHQLAYGKAREALEHARRAGELLIQAKAGLPHGSFGPWLALNFNFSDRTARGYMRLASHWNELQAKTATVADLPLPDALRVLTEIAEPGPAARAEDFRRLRDEILGSDDLDEIHPKMRALYSVAMWIMHDTDDLGLLAEMCRDDLTRHVHGLTIEAMRKCGAALAELKKMTRLGESDLLRVVNDGLLLRAARGRLAELEGAVA